MPGKPNEDVQQPQPRRTRIRRVVRQIGLAISGLCIVALLVIARPLIHLVSSIKNDVNDRIAVPNGYIDDASAMNATAIRRLQTLPNEIQAAEVALRNVLHEAEQKGLSLAVAGARHSMGGHSIAPNGIVVDMTAVNQMELDEEQSVLTVGAGAIWHDVIAYLDRQGFSVAVMQSNDSFTVGGSVSVNCHGWQCGSPPICATVDSFRLMTADGQVRVCSRTENEELFALVLGGYGLFGIILDVRLRVIPNALYRCNQEVIALKESVQLSPQFLKNAPDVKMAYARLDVSPENFLKAILICRMSEAPSPEEGLEAVQAPAWKTLRRAIFRGSAGTSYGKAFRWQAETNLQPWFTPGTRTRNQLIDEGADVFANRSQSTTDILHEYFVPAERFQEWIVALREVVSGASVDLLNVTIREVEQDDDTFLCYADRRMLAAVMLFQQPRTQQGEEAMKRLTRKLIDRVIALEGRYYLPYRLHATPEQFHRAYPQAKVFFDLKRRYDPQERFINKFYQQYGRTDVVAQAD